MKKKIQAIILAAVEKAYIAGHLNTLTIPVVGIEEPKIEAQGDFSTNIAMIMASVQKMPPQKIAGAIIKHIFDNEKMFKKIEIAGPGFINFFVNNSCRHEILHIIHKEDKLYGSSDIGKGERVQVEFVSANPTGPLHVGHGRGAVIGDSLARILQFCGYDVKKEYYINDSGRQIHTLGLSVLLRCREIFGDDILFPDDCYQGDYIRDMAESVIKQKGKALMDGNVEDAISFCSHFASKRILAGIKTDLESLGVQFDEWFSEQSLFDSGKVKSVLNDFKKCNRIYEKDGALWFRTTDYGDEKDRVVVRKNGQTTYFASDIAYHQDKLHRGFNKIVDIWGADHHGYIPRVAASIKASGHDSGKFKVILVQLVNLLRKGKPVAMSTRGGEFVSLKDVIEEVGSDAARFIFLTRNYDSSLDFDLERAKQKTNDNPVYYVQYVHARISSIIKKSRGKNGCAITPDCTAVKILDAPEEINLIKVMGRYPEVVKNSATLMEPHRITYYLMDLAASFHTYYNKHRVLTDDPVLTGGRLYLVMAVKKIIYNGLSLLGVSAPVKM